ncbi:metallophosphoesterase family protein [Nanoarchaeota archaeon]
MGRIAFLSDIHGNFEALEAVIAHAETKGVDRFVSFGDLIGYGPSPVECLDTIQRLDIDSVLGNHEKLMLDHRALYNREKKKPYGWVTDDVAQTVMRSHLLLVDQEDFLDNLPYTLWKGEEKVVVTHSSLVLPTNFNYIKTVKEAEQNFRLFEEDEVLGMGHTHVPKVWSLKDGLTYYTVPEGSCTIDLVGEKHIINAGSIGQPRDDDWRACYAIYDSDAKTVEFYRVEYAIQETVRKIENTKLPNAVKRSLVEKLKGGRRENDS